MKGDPVIDEIREIRRKISESCGHDPHKLVERYRELEKKYAGRFWKGRKYGRAGTDSKDV